MSTASSPAWASIRVGDTVPPLDVPLTATRIVAGAIASRDFMPVHHSTTYAKQQGAPDIFMNILTTNGYVARFVTDWAGPEARLTNISIRLGAPAIPNTTLRFTGEVVRTEAVAEGTDGADDTDGTAEGEVEVTLRGVTELGEHVSGTVRLRLPR
jgi:acyl dehydratase